MKEIFGSLGISYFIDEKRSLISNPLIEYLRAAVLICADDYSYEGIFRLLKCPLSGIDRNLTDRLENYVLGCGIRGKKKWQADFYRAYAGEDPAEVPELNRLRKEICGLLEPLSDVFSKRGSTVLEKTAALYEFCERSGVYEKLNAMKDGFDADGRPELVQIGRAHV